MTFAILTLLLAAALLVPAAALAAEPASFADAEWLRDPQAVGHGIVDLPQPPGEEPPAYEGPVNLHTLLRKTFTLSSKPARAALRFSADDYAKIYISGRFIVQGPEPGYPWAYPYFEVDVTDALKPGTNVFAVHLYYQGLRNRVWNSADNRSGFIAQLELTFPDGGTRTVLTDDSWRLHALEAFPAQRTTGYDTQFLEDIDLRKWPEGWRTADFDDAAWAAPETGRQDHAFERAKTPPLEHWRAEPIMTHNMGEGRWLFDFGQELVGHLRFHVHGDAGHVVEVRCGEELSAPDAVRHELRANCDYREEVTLRQGANTAEFYDYKGFRYVELRNCPEEPQVWVDVRHYPFDPEAAALDAPEPLLEAMWTLCSYGVRFGSQGGFLDCPTREKGQYLGDALITGKSHLYLMADPRLTRKALADFQQSQRIHPAMLCVAPGSLSQQFAEYSLQWPLLLQTYFRLTGDRFSTHTMAEAALEPLFEHFAQFETEAGLLKGPLGMPVLVDWPKNLRGDFDYDYALERENAVVNAFWIAALDAAAELCRSLGLGPAPYAAKAAKARDGFERRLWDAETGLYRDAPGSKQHSLHTNALALRFGIASEAAAPGILALIRERALDCGVYIAPFIIEACYEGGAPDLGYGLLTNTDEHSWQEMLRHGATTCMEAWGPDQKWNTSWCHPWSSSPIYLIIERVLGLTPGDPGWGRIRCAPQIPSGLDRLVVTFPIPGGRITADYDKAEGYRLRVPPIAEVDTGDAAISVAVERTIDHGPGRLSTTQAALLEEYGWAERVGGEGGVWVSAGEQKVRWIQDGAMLWEVPCSTAAKGIGSLSGSNKTPPGWHRVDEKFGGEASWGQVFRARQATGELWQPGAETNEDLVLTRILWLEGLEPGTNRGGNVDSKRRYIYFHGTNGEADIGTPASHGCIRLRNADVLTAYDLFPVGTLVLITPE